MQKEVSGLRRSKEALEAYIVNELGKATDLASYEAEESDDGLEWET